MISPSAVYPGLFSPRTTLTPPGIVSNVCDTVVDVSGFACEFKLNIPIEIKCEIILFCICGFSNQFEFLLLNISVYYTNVSCICEYNLIFIYIAIWF